MWLEPVEARDSGSKSLARNLSSISSHVPSGVRRHATVRSQGGPRFDRRDRERCSGLRVWQDPPVSRYRQQWPAPRAVESADFTLL